VEKYIVTNFDTDMCLLEFKSIVNGPHTTIDPKTKFY